MTVMTIFRIWMIYLILNRRTLIVLLNLVKGEDKLVLAVNFEAEYLARLLLKV